MSGQFSIDIGLAGQVVTILQNVDNDVAQYRSQLINLVNQLEGSWNSPNKSSFYNDWVTYCNAIIAIGDVGPHLVQGLNQEISLVTQAEQVQF